jgi:hypothetical protein
MQIHLGELHLGELHLGELSAWDEATNTFTGMDVTPVYQSPEEIQAYELTESKKRALEVRFKSLFNALNEEIMRRDALSKAGDVKAWAPYANEDAYGKAYEEAFMPLFNLRNSPQQYDTPDSAASLAEQDNTISKVEARVKSAGLLPSAAPTTGTGVSTTKEPETKSPAAPGKLDMGPLLLVAGAGLLLFAMLGKD